MRPSSPNPVLWVTPILLKTLCRQEDAMDIERAMEVPDVNLALIHNLLRLPKTVQIVGRCIDYNLGRIGLYLSGPDLPDTDNLLAVYEGTYPDARFVRFEPVRYGGAPC